MAADMSTLVIEVDSRGVTRARNELGQFVAMGDRSATAADKVSSAWGKFSGVLAGLGLGLVARELVQVADTMSLLDARLKMSTKSSAEFIAAQTDIYRIAQKNNVGIKETTELYVKLSDPIRALGGSTKEVAAISESFAASLRVGGASAQEASAATRQFAQAMASGVLRGDEFNSIAEASPRFMKAMADGIGVPTGALRKMAEEGKLTADVVGNALVGGLAKLQAESASMPDTVGGAFQRLNNDIATTIGKFNEATGATLSLASGIGVVADIAGRLSSVMSASLADGVTKAGDSFDFLSASIRVVGTVFETLMVLGLNVSFVLKGVGREIGGIGAQLAALATGDFKAFSAIRQEMISDSDAARAALDRETSSIVGMTDKALQARDIVKGFSLSQAEASNEMARLTAKTNAAASSYAKLKSTIADSGKAAKPIKATEDPAYKEAMRAAQLRQELRIRENDQIAAFYREQQDLQIKEVAKLRAAAESINDRAEAQENANKTFGKGKAALEELTLAQLEQNKATVMASDVVLPGVIDAIEQQIAAQKRLISATSTGEMLEAEKKRMDDMKEEWKKTTESINNSLTDALLRGFESGKGFAENLRDTLKNMFKTLVLKPVISAVVNPVSQGISSLFSGGGGGAGGGLGGLGGIGSALGSLGSMFGGLGGVTAGFQGATLAAGLAGPTTVGATGLTGLGASLGAGFGALGTAMPYLGAALALYSLTKHKKTPHLGSAVNASGGVATTDMTDYLAGNYNAESDQALRYLTLGSTGSLNKLSGMFGGGQFSANAKFASDNKDPSAADATIFMGGKEVSALGGEGYKLYASGSEEAFKAFTKDFEGLTLQAIKSMEKLPVYVKAEFDKLGEGATIEGIAALVDQIGVFRSQLDTMRMAIGSLGSTTDEALSSIIANTGGIQQFSAAIDTYYNNFFTQAERTTFATQQLSEQFARLGVEMPQTRKDFRDLVESTATTSEEGQKLYSALLSLSGAFASVVPEAEEAKAAIANIATGAVEAAKQAIESSYAPLTSSYGTTVQNGVSFTTANISDIMRSAASSAADSMGMVTNAINDASGAWKAAADSIDAEIRRIRGEISGTGKQGEAKALTSFATLTAQARAGDVNAASMLPKASQDYLSLAAGNASTASELRRAQSTTLASLMQTQQALGLAPAIGFSSPTAPVMPGTSAASSGSLDALIAEVKALKLAMEIAQAASNVNTKKTADILVRVTEGGDAMLTRAAP